MNIVPTTRPMIAIMIGWILEELMFNLFSPPCFAAIGAMNAEINNRKWLFAGVGIQLSVGYSIGFLTYFFGTVLTGGTLIGWMSILGWVIVAAIVAIFTFVILKKREEVKREAEEKKAVTV